MNEHGKSPAPARRPARHTRQGRPRWVALAAIGCILGLAAAACSGGGGGSTSSRPHAGSGASKTPPAGQGTLSITPASGSANVNPAQGITVTATQGKIRGVTVTTSGEPVTGALNAARTSWHSTWALNISQSYTVTARATGSSGQVVTLTSTFRTLTPAQTLRTQILEGQGQTYGVGMPIILYFDHEITNKAAVERALQLTTSKPVVGSWHWDDPCNMATVCLYFRPRSYWPANTQVSFTGHLDGVEAAPGVFGVHTLTQSFTIGDSLIVVASTATHHMDLYRNGALFARWPISSGRPGDDTPNGTYLTIDKGNPVIMKGPGYTLPVPWSVRFTWSGDYLHDAYWSVGQQGNSNVSHGCVNMPPADAQTYYQMEVPGDPVTITGSPRAGVWDDGWTMWFLPWSRYMQGSALGEAVQAGPGGSTFVSPSLLPASTAAVPLGAPDPGNWAAS